MGKIQVLLIVIILIVVRYYQTLPDYKTGEKIRITSTLHTQPVNYERSQYFKLYGLKIYLPLYPEVSYGDKVVIEGIVDEDKLSEAKLIAVIESNNPIHKTREKLLLIYKKSLPQDEAALFSGVTIGSKSGITESFWEKLKKSGTAHVVVASGMNITFIAAFLMSIAVTFFKRGRALYIVTAGVWLYALLCGFEAPVVRAALMGTIAFAAQETGRLSDTLRAVFICAIVMLLIFPQWITDTGFILSFGATISLIIFSKKVSTITSRTKVLKLLPKIFKEALDTSLAAQIAVIPILFLTFGSFNPFSIVANTLTLWTIPLITVLGFIGGAMGLIYQPAGTLVLLLSYPLARYFTFVIEIFS